jgi:hypothetical protein
MPENTINKIKGGLTKIPKWIDWTVIFILAIYSVGLTIYHHYFTDRGVPSIPEEIANISRQMLISVIEPSGKNRTLFLNPYEWYCKVIVFYGGTKPYPQDLAYPEAPIAFFFLEDIEDSEKADNWSDLIIRMNQIVEGGKSKMCVVFFGEGASQKLVYYKGQLIYHYRDDDPTSNYGIVLLETN